MNNKTKTNVRRDTRQEQRKPRDGQEVGVRREHLYRKHCERERNKTQKRVRRKETPGDPTKRKVPRGNCYIENLGVLERVWGGDGVEVLYRIKVKCPATCCGGTGNTRLLCNWPGPAPPRSGRDFKALFVFVGLFVRVYVCVCVCSCGFCFYIWLFFFFLLPYVLPGREFYTRGSPSLDLSLSFNILTVLSLFLYVAYSIDLRLYYSKNFPSFLFELVFIYFQFMSSSWSVFAYSKELMNIDISNLFRNLEAVILTPLFLPFQCRYVLGFYSLSISCTSGTVLVSRC